MVRIFHRTRTETLFLYYVIWKMASIDRKFRIVCQTIVISGRRLSSPNDHSISFDSCWTEARGRAYKSFYFVSAIQPYNITTTGTFTTWHESLPVNRVRSFYDLVRN